MMTLRRSSSALGLKKQLIAEKETKDGRAAAKTAAAEVEEAADQAEKKPRVGMEYEVKQEFKQKGIAASFDIPRCKQVILRKGRFKGTGSVLTSCWWLYPPDVSG